MDSWGTPDWLMNVFEGWFDPCPLNPNPEHDGLKMDWGRKTYINPPYSNPLPWVEKAIEESKKGKTVAMLLKVDTSTRWYAKIVESKARIFWLLGRIKFKQHDSKLNVDKWQPAGFPSMLVIFTTQNTHNMNSKSAMLPKLEARETGSEVGENGSDCERNSPNSGSHSSAKVVEEIKRPLADAQNHANVQGEK